MYPVSRMEKDPIRDKTPPVMSMGDMVLICTSFKLTIYLDSEILRCTLGLLKLSIHSVSGLLAAYQRLAGLELNSKLSLLQMVFKFENSEIDFTKKLGEKNWSKFSQSIFNSYKY
jgi:hypothetical protein